MSPISTRRLRRPFAWLLIAQQLLAGAGMSLPCPAAAAGSAERCPFEHCGCACRSAEQCWAHCSCFTYQEKVEQGPQYGVAVPECVVAAAKRKAAVPGKPACAHAHCHRQGVPPAGGPFQDVRTGNEDEQGRNKNRSSGGFCWLRALRRHGLTQLWQAARESWPGDRHVEPCLLLLPRGRVEWQPFVRHLFSPSPPPTPPPNDA
ncbi:MAG: hypothetical protein ACLQNE_06920 [Thermoguttaceae bacterium]